MPNYNHTNYGDNPEFRRKSQKVFVDRVTNDVILRLHETDIVRVRPNGDVILCTGGWATHKTLHSMNDALELMDMWLESSGNIPRGNWLVYDSDGTVIPYDNDKINYVITIPGKSRPGGASSSSAAAEVPSATVAPAPAGPAGSTITGAPSPTQGGGLRALEVARSKLQASKAQDGDDLSAQGPTQLAEHIMKLVGQYNAFDVLDQGDDDVDTDAWEVVARKTAASKKAAGTSEVKSAAGIKNRAGTASNTAADALAGAYGKQGSAARVDDYYRAFEHLYRDPATNDVILRFHKTNVVRIRQNGEVVLTAGGWYTYTTLAAINDAMQAMNMRVLHHGQPAAGAWLVKDDQGRQLPFQDGMVLQPTRPEHRKRAESVLKAYHGSFKYLNSSSSNNSYSLTSKDRLHPQALFNLD
eukprot:gene9434-9599_t